METGKGTVPIPVIKMTAGKFVFITILEHTKMFVILYKNYRTRFFITHKLVLNQFNKKADYKFTTIFMSI